MKKRNQKQTTVVFGVLSCLCKALGVCFKANYNNAVPTQSFFPIHLGAAEQTVYTMLTVIILLNYYADNN